MYIIIFLWFFYGVCKAFSDSWRDMRTTNAVAQYIMRHGGLSSQAYLWYNGQRGLFTTWIGQGWFFSSDYWHFWDNLRGYCFLFGCFLSPFLLRGMSLFHIVILACFCFWLPSFQFFYHVVLCHDWSFLRWVINTLLFWRVNI